MMSLFEYVKSIYKSICRENFIGSLIPNGKSIRKKYVNWRVSCEFANRKEVLGMIRNHKTSGNLISLEIIKLPI